MQRRSKPAGETEEQARSAEKHKVGGKHARRGKRERNEKQTHRETRGKEYRGRRKGRHGELDMRTKS